MAYEASILALTVSHARRYFVMASPTVDARFFLIKSLAKCGLPALFKLYNQLVSSSLKVIEYTLLRNAIRLSRFSLLKFLTLSISLRSLGLFLS